MRQAGTLDRTMPGGTMVSLPVRLAKQAAEHAIKTGEILPLPAALPPELTRQRACYVFVFEDPSRQLRRVGGSILPAQPSLAAEIISNTTHAITGLFRRADIPHLHFSVGVAGQLQRISDSLHLNPSLFGLYLRSERGKHTVILPQRAGIETAEDQIATAMRESGIDPQQEVPTLYRFTMQFYE